MSKNKGKVLQLNITSLYLSFSVKFFIFYHLVSIYYMNNHLVDYAYNIFSGDGSQEVIAKLDI